MPIQELLALLAGGGGGTRQQPQNVDPRLEMIQKMMMGGQGGPNAPDPRQVPGNGYTPMRKASPMGDGVDEDPSLDESMNQEPSIRPRGSRNEDQNILEMIQQQLAGDGTPSKEELQELIDNPTDSNISRFIREYGREALPEEMQNPDPDAPDYVEPDNDEDDED